MEVIDYDAKIKKNLMLTYIFGSLSLISVILAILFLVISAIRNDLISIILFVEALIASILGLMFDNARRKNVKYKDMTSTIPENEEEKEKHRQFRAETQAKLDTKMMTDRAFRQLRKK